MMSNNVYLNIEFKMRTIKYLICFALLAISVSSCSLFGLDFQENESYNAKKGNNEINMDTWTFIQSRPDIFSTLIDGIKYAGIEELYKEVGNTHILLTNSALSNGENSFWQRNKITINGQSVSATAWEQYDKVVVKELLAYHILKGEWSYFNLSSNTNWVNTYGNGKFSYTEDGITLEGDTAVIDILAAHDRSLPLQINNYDWNFRGVLAVTNGTCRTTNIKALNGYIHVSDWYQPRPSKAYWITSIK